MYQSFEIQNFRGIKHLSISDLKRINLITGKNNVGKTAVLEALFLDIGFPNYESPIKINAFRGFEFIKVELSAGTETPWDSLFYSYAHNPITFTSIDSSGQNKKISMQIFHDENDFIKLKIDKSLRDLLINEILPRSDFDYYKTIQQTLPTIPSTSIPTDLLKKFYILLCSSVINRKKKDYAMTIGLKGLQIYPNPEIGQQKGYFLTAKRFENLREIADLFGYFQKNRLDEELCDILRFIEPKLTDLTVVMEGNQPLIEGDIGLTRLLPINLMGEGMVTIFVILLYIANARNGFVLIDEIENGFHHSILPNVWKIIGAAAEKYNVQIFATTHSFECITSSIEAFKNNENDFFGLYRLDKHDEESKITAYSIKELEDIQKFNIEVR